MCVSTGNQMVDLVIVGAAVAMTGGFAAAPLAAGAAASAGAAGAAASTITAASVASGLATTVSIAGTISALNQTSYGEQQAQLPAVTQPISQVTGSGGVNAPKVLAEKIREVNRPQPSAPTGAQVSSTGLQLSN